MLVRPRAVLREATVAYRFVESPNKTVTTGRTIDIVVIHTMEIAEQAEAAAICARWFASPVSQVSAHYCVDAGTVIQCVREKDIAWHARGGNAASVGIELAGFARQTAEGWADVYSSREPLASWRTSAGAGASLFGGSRPTTSSPAGAGSRVTPR